MARAIKPEDIEQIYITWTQSFDNAVLYELSHQLHNNKPHEFNKQILSFGIDKYNAAISNEERQCVVLFFAGFFVKDLSTISTLKAFFDFLAHKSTVYALHSIDYLGRLELVRRRVNSGGDDDLKLRVLTAEEKMKMMESKSLYR